MRSPKTVHLKDFNKDLTFKITPLSATRAEDLLLRICLLSGKNLDLDSSSLGGKEVLKALISASPKEAKEILDELLFCCARVEGNTEIPVSYADLDGYIENPLTISKLRIESIKVNFGFFFDGSLPDFRSMLNS